MRIMICRKEAKETQYWLNLIDVSNGLNDAKRELLDEVVQLRKIFGKILENSKI